MIARRRERSRRRKEEGCTQKMGLCHVLYVASREDFFDTPYKIDCGVEKYCAFTGANMVLGIYEVYKKRLINVGEGIMISKPVVVERGFKRKGGCFNASLSHWGILAIYLYNKKNIVQFTNLRNEEQVEVEVEADSSVAFYDVFYSCLRLCKCFSILLGPFRPTAVIPNLFHLFSQLLPCLLRFCIASCLMTESLLYVDKHISLDSDSIHDCSCLWSHSCSSIELHNV